ncbi:hypothetical protein [Peribacillus sp. NPDC056705]
MTGEADVEVKQKISEAFEQFGQAAVMDMILKMLRNMQNKRQAV